MFTSIFENSFYDNQETLIKAMVLELSMDLTD